MEDVSRWEVAGSASVYLHFLSRGEVTSSGDRALRCQAPGLRGQNLKDIKRASISKTADLPNVNCHLTSLLTTNNTTTTSVPPGSCCRSGVERELNQGFSCYKSPSTPAGEQRQADRNKRPRNGTGSLFSRELKTERCSSTNRLGGKGMRRWEINKKLLFFSMRRSLIIIDFWATEVFSIPNKSSFGASTGWKIRINFTSLFRLCSC